MALSQLLITSLPVYLPKSPSVFLLTHHSTFYSPQYKFRSHLADVLPSSSIMMTDQSPRHLLPLLFPVDDTHHRRSRDTTQVSTKLLKIISITQLFFFLLKHVLKTFTQHLSSVNKTTHTFIA